MQLPELKSILEQCLSRARELCYAVEQLPASERQTEISVQVSAVLQRIERELSVILIRRCVVMKGGTCQHFIFRLTPSEVEWTTERSKALIVSESDAQSIVARLQWSGENAWKEAVP